MADPLSRQSALIWIPCHTLVTTMSHSLTKVVVSLHRSKYRGTCLLVEFVECLARSDEVLKPL